MDRVAQAVTPLSQLRARRREEPRIRSKFAELRDRHGELAVPVGLEARGRLAGDGSSAQHVHILEIELADAEVFVTDVAAAENRRDAVGDELLVMHAAVDAGEARQQLTQA